MGVKDLWTILAPVKREEPLESLRDRTLAIDLSVWICETHSVKQMQGVVTKPHLRNLFFRVQHLLQLNIRPVFVLDGEAPELKWETMAKRTQARYSWRGRGRGALMSTGRKPGRGHFNSRMKECCSLLDYLGVAHVQAEGEAEAMCAFLNQKGLVDGVVTEDGDAFLYGATTVYRNFSINGKNPQVECYKMQDIETRLNIDRQGLVAMGLLLGCDFCPKGVPGVGKETALKLVEALNGENILERFRTWRFGESFDKLDQLSAIKKVAHCTTCKHPGSSKEHTSRGCELCGSDKYCEPQSYEYECRCEWHRAQKKLSLRTAELAVRKKALDIPDFPSRKVIDEFTKSRNILPRKSVKWKRPEKIPLQKFSFEKMEWPEEYTEEKVVPLLTLWDMRNIEQVGRFDPSVHLKPNSIVKTRVRNGVPSYEVQWHKHFNDRTTDSEFHVTIEAQDIFSSCHPNIVYDFESAAPVKKNQRKDSKKKSTKKDSSNPADDAADQLLNLTLEEMSNEKKCRAKSFGKDKTTKRNKLSCCDVFDDLIEEEAAQMQSGPCHVLTSIKSVKKKESPQKTKAQPNDLLGSVNLDSDINIENLEEADLLALPLSQRLKIRSLMSSQLSQIDGNTIDSDPRKTRIHNFSSDEDEDEDLPPVSFTVPVKETCSPTPKDAPFYHDDDEIISGVLPAQFPCDTYSQLSSDGLKHLSHHYDDFVSEMSNMSIDVEELPTLNVCSGDAQPAVDTMICNNVTRTVCLDVNSTQFNGIVHTATHEETRVINNLTDHTVCLQVQAPVSRSISKGESEISSVGTTDCLDRAETICVEIGHKVEGSKDLYPESCETFQCELPDLTKTQLICTDLSLQFDKGKRQTRDFCDKNLTRGCFDLQTNFTLSLGETTHFNTTTHCSTLSTTLKLPESEVTHLVTVGSPEPETEIIDLTCTMETPRLWDSAETTLVNTLCVPDEPAADLQEEPVLIVSNDFSPGQKTKDRNSSCHRTASSSEATLLVGNQTLSQDLYLSETFASRVFDTFVADSPEEGHTVCLEVADSAPSASVSETDSMCAAETTTIVDVVNIDSFCEPYEETEVSDKYKPDSITATPGNHCDKRKILLLDVSCDDMDVSLVGGSKEQEMNMSLDYISDPSKPLSSHFVQESPMCNNSQTSPLSPAGFPDVNFERTAASRKFSNRTAGANFMIDSSLLSSFSDGSRYLSGSSSSAKSSSVSNGFASESSLSSGTTTSVGSSSDLEPSTCRSKKSKSKKNLRGVARDGKIDKENKKGKRQKSIRSDILAGPLTEKFESSQSNEESLLDLVDNIITSQVPAKKCHKKRFNRKDFVKIVSQSGESQQNEMSLLDLVDEVISCTQETKKMTKLKKTKKSKGSTCKSKTTSL